jgi:hypothetical protein
MPAPAGGERLARMAIPNPTRMELERRAVMTVESTIPAEMTIEQWRALRRPLPAGRRAPMRLSVLRGRTAWPARAI